MYSEEEIAQRVAESGANALLNTPNLRFSKYLSAKDKEKIAEQVRLIIKEALLENMKSK